MAASNRCSQCAADRLSVIYYDAKGQPLGGHSQCTECGPRSVEVIELHAEVRKKLLEKKAS